MKQHALFPLIALLAAALVAGCATANSVRSEQESTAESEAGGSTEQAVVATTMGDLSGKEATVGVSSTTEQAEVSRGESSSASPAGEGSVASSAEPSPDPFVADPQARGGEGYGADGLLGVRYGVHEGYERVVIDLGAGGQPAGSVPEWVLSSPTGDGVLRVTVPSASTTRVSGGAFSGSLLKNFHVVRAPEGGMFVDVFAESAFTYRVIELLDPARLVVDFKPSEATLDLPLPKESGNTVLVEPRRGTSVGGSLTLSGYSRNPEASNTVVLTDASGKELIRDTVVSNDWTATWGYFETTLDLPPFSGRATLKVGAESARDGTFEGVEIPVYGTG
ncbi:MAG: Gmad2 immunoglobulin-like domain-containing protein [Rubrobacteraceae bacterium]